MNAKNNKIAEPSFAADRYSAVVLKCEVRKTQCRKHWQLSEAAAETGVSYIDK
jgi:phage gp16-like protein